MQVVDGERLPLSVKELGSCDLYPQASAKVTLNLELLLFFKSERVNKAVEFRTGR